MMSVQSTHENCEDFGEICNGEGEIDCDIRMCEKFDAVAQS